MSFRPSRLPTVHRVAYAAARRGALPAEELPAALAEQLVAELVGQGWSDPEIAAHTRWTPA